VGWLRFLLVVLWGEVEMGNLMKDMYQLPESLGGGECELLSSVVAARGTVLVEVRVTKSMTIHVPWECLTKVAPKLPTEPTVAKVVEAGGVVYRRSGAYSRPAHWLRIGSIRPFTWAEICKLGDPIPLESMGPVQLPWSGHDVLGVEVEVRAEVGLAHCVTVRTSVRGNSDHEIRARLHPNTAKAIAKALWTAATEVAAS
jgi:hypothetical protein